MFIGWRISLLSVSAAVALCWPAMCAAQDAESCAAGAADVAGMIDCLKRSRERQAACDGAQSHPLAVPVEGRRILSFGDKTQYGSTSMGAVIESEGGAIARAPVAGTILYAGNFRTYGNLIIIDACAYNVLLAGLAESTVAVGQTVAREQPIGAMGAASGGNLPVLYLEVRIDGKSVDPVSVPRK